MSEVDLVPQLGEVVCITRGRETGQYAIIIKELDDKYVLLADGEKRKYDQPKKKNLNHIKATGYVSSEIKSNLLETNRVTNGRLRFAISKFVNAND